MAEEKLDFWEHLDILRKCIIRSLIVVAICGLLAFYFKDFLFEVVLAPVHPDFVTYRLLNMDSFSIDLVNISLTEQFMIHVKTAFCFGFLIGSPFVLLVLYKFVSPALYMNERRYARLLVGTGYLMFFIGLLINYFFIFPLTLRFLGTYQVSDDVRNMLSLQSYVDTFLMMSFIFGVLFELPVISWLLALMGLLKTAWLKHYRRHAIVVIVVIAAVITPTGDAFTLTMVSLPIWLLYEMSVIVVHITNRFAITKSA